VAKRASLTFEAVKASKAAPAPVEALAEPIAPAKAKAGRKAKRTGQVYGMTLRVSPELRRALRTAADQETDKAGRVVSVHDVVMTAIERHLSRRGIRVDG
jgi:hypothetical protein